ncbi:Endoplasmic reticulum transmembrane protein 3 [Smittium mucronatum]|uniref:Endoplasmic reticulum transmembrane protein 3 n=1 Tax=Smittium mucronatum TaxID=133383 RepID=A0A1R0H781_9FUNG|nr:Endoplasmic reticulum transmembrane protein 3 [Smittium mucronatum]
MKAKRYHKSGLEPGNVDLDLNNRDLVSKFYAQRNIYLTGITLLLGLIMISTYNLIGKLLAAKNESADLSKIDSVSHIKDQSKIESLDAEISSLNKKIAVAQLKLDSMKL